MKYYRINIIIAGLLYFCLSTAFTGLSIKEKQENCVVGSPEYKRFIYINRNDSVEFNIWNIRPSKAQADPIDLAPLRLMGIQTRNTEINHLNAIINTLFSGRWNHEAYLVGLVLYSREVNTFSYDKHNIDAVLLYTAKKGKLYASVFRKENDSFIILESLSMPLYPMTTNSMLDLARGLLYTDENDPYICLQLINDAYFNYKGDARTIGLFKEKIDKLRKEHK